jgi:hypothetical protein
MTQNPKDNPTWKGQNEAADETGISLNQGRMTDVIEK